MEGRNGPAAGRTTEKETIQRAEHQTDLRRRAGRFVPVPWPQRPRRRRDRDGGYIRNRACSRRRGGGLLCRLGGVPGPYSGQDPGGAPDPDQLRLRPDRPGDIDPRPGGPGPRQKEPRRPAGAPAGAPPPEAHHLRGRVVGLSVFLRRRVHGCQTGEVRRQLRGLHRGARSGRGGPGLGVSGVRRSGGKHPPAGGQTEFHKAPPGAAGPAGPAGPPGREGLLPHHCRRRRQLVSGSDRGGEGGGHRGPHLPDGLRLPRPLGAVCGLQRAPVRPLRRISPGKDRCRRLFGGVSEKGRPGGKDRPGHAIVRLRLPGRKQ